MDPTVNTLIYSINFVSNLIKVCNVLFEDISATDVRTTMMMIGLLKIVYYSNLGKYEDRGKWVNKLKDEKEDCLSMYGKKVKQLRNCKGK